MYGTIIDITVRKQKDNALVRMNQELRQFAYAAAHDLQEPSRTVALSLQMLRTSSKQLDTDADALLDDAICNAQRMHSMTIDLLAFTTALDLSPSDQWPVIDANDVLSDVQKSLAVHLKGSGAKIICGELPRVRMHRVHLHQLLQNLISNAVKYHSDMEPVIHVLSEPEFGFRRFHIRDNGIGIHSSQHQRIFGPF